MGSVLHLNDAHEWAQMLMPWRVNGTLDESEAALFEAHLKECAECRADLAAEEALSRELAGLPMPELESLTARPSLELPKTRRSATRRSLLARPIPLGWALAAPAAIAAAVALVLVVPRAGSDDQSDYRLLASEGNARAGNVVVMFSPDATERDLRVALAGAEARIVDGPTPSGAYIVHVAPAERRAALERLRGMEQVLMAEGIDATGGP